MNRPCVRNALILAAGLGVLTAVRFLTGPTAAEAQQAAESLLNLHDNSWRQLALAPSARYLTPKYVITPTPVADPNPRTRAYSGLVAGGNRVFYFGGAHASYPGNDVEVFDPVSLGWDQSYKPEVCPYTTSAPCYDVYNGWGTMVTTPLGQPYVEHTYQVYGYDPSRNRLLSILNNGTWEYDLASRRWTALAGPAAGSTFSPRGVGVGTRHLFAFDSGLGAFQAVVTSGDTRGTYRFDSSTRQWNKRGGPPETGWATLYSTYAADRAIHFVYAVSWTQHWWKYDARNDQWTALPAPPAVPDSFDYDSRNRAVVAVNHTTSGSLRVMVFDPDASRWTELPSLTPGPLMRAGMTSTPMAWRYVPSHNVFIFLAGDRGSIAGGASTTWAYRYRGDAGPGAPGSDVTAPTVTMVAPSSGAQVSGVVSLRAVASDNIGVANVQFRVDGIDLGSPATGTPYAASWDTRQVPDGTHTVGAVARDGAGNMALSAAVTVTVTNTTTSAPASTPPPTGIVTSTTPTAPRSTPSPTGTVTTVTNTTPTAPRSTSVPVDGSMTFARRSAQPGVVRAWKFAAGEDIAGFIAPGWESVTPNATPTRTVLPAIDSVVGGLRFRVPPYSPADSSGSFSMNFTPNSLNQVHSNGDPDKGSGYYSVQFGEGQEFYVQWRQRFSPEFLSNQWAGGGGQKLIILGEGDRAGHKASSCTQLEVVTNNGYYRGSPQMYHSCGGKDGRYETLTERLLPLTPEEYTPENEVPNCYWYGDQSGCVRFVPDQWMTFQIHIKIGTWYLNDGNYHRDSWVELWIAEDGQPQRLVHSRRDYDLANSDNPAAAKYGKLWLLPYNTGKTLSAYAPEAYTWYDEVIVSRTPIADPAPYGTSPPASDPAPSTPSSPAPRLTLTSLIVDKTSPEPAGTTTTFAATASGGRAPYTYKWWVDAGAGWNVIREWSSSNTYAWTPATPGTYQIAVWARSAGKTADTQEDAHIFPFTITAVAPVTASVPAASTPAASTPAVSIATVSTATVSTATASAPAASTPTALASTVSTAAASTPTVSTATASAPAASAPAASAPAASAPTVSASTVSTAAASTPTVSTATASAPAASAPTVSASTVSTAAASTPAASTSTTSAPTVSTPTAVTRSVSTPSTGAGSSSTSFGSTGQPSSGSTALRSSTGSGEGSLDSTAPSPSTNTSSGETPSVPSSLGPNEGVRQAASPSSSSAFAFAPLSGTGTQEDPVRAEIVGNLRGDNAGARFTSPLRLTSVRAVDGASQAGKITTILTVTASGGTRPYAYKWLIYDGRRWNLGQDWSASNIFAWTPTTAGDYRIAVWARSNGNIANEQEDGKFVTLTIPPAPGGETQRGSEPAAAAQQDDHRHGGRVGGGG